MGALSKYGVTNERLDEVSNHYRYRREQGEMWPTRAAQAYAVVANGKIVRFEIVEGGEGYSSAPTIRVPGYADSGALATLGFDRRFDTNGSIRSIALASGRG